MRGSLCSSAAAPAPLLPRRRRFALLHDSLANRDPSPRVSAPALMRDLSLLRVSPIVAVDPRREHIEGRAAFSSLMQRQGGRTTRIEKLSLPRHQGVPPLLVSRQTMTRKWRELGRAADHFSAPRSITLPPSRSALCAQSRALVRRLFLASAPAASDQAVPMYGDVKAGERART